MIGLWVTVMFMFLLAGLSFVGTMAAFSYEKSQKIRTKRTGKLIRKEVLI